MVGFIEQWRVRELVLVVVVLGGATWLARRRAPSTPPPAVAPSTTIAAAGADEPSPCLEPRPAGGIYALADGSMHVAVVDGCVAARFSPPRWSGSIAAPHAPAARWGAVDDRTEVLLVPSGSHIAGPGDGTSLRVVSDRELAVFERHSTQTTITRSPDRALALVAPLDDRGPGAAVGLLAHDELAVQAAALSRLLQDRLDDPACAAIGDWLVRARRDRDRYELASVVLVNADDRCLVPAIRAAVDEPSLVLPASTALAKLGTPAERADALLAVLDAELADGTYQAAEKLAEYLHPDHCGVDMQERCLAPAAAAELERSLRQRLDLHDVHTALLVLHALRAYLLSERYASFAIELAASAPCPAVEWLVSSFGVSSLTGEQIAPAFARVLGRRSCARGRYVAALELASHLGNATASETDWALLGAYLDDARLSGEERLRFASRLGRSYGCYPRTRDRHPTAEAVLARVQLGRCPAP